MNINKYFNLLQSGKTIEAEQFRMSSIPDRVVKYISLSGDENDNDNKKYKSLRSDEVWFSNIKELNDPYEFKAMMIDQERLVAKGYPKALIEKYNTIFDFEDYGVTCFSSNPIDYLPMWAYYTNNHKGFCVEYEVVKKDCIHEVLYEPDRIKIASIFFQYESAVKKAKLKGKHTSQADYYAKYFIQNLFIKAESWKHENEYRIVYPIGDSNGVNVSVNKLGLKTKRIIAGINCSKESLNKLNEISQALKLGNVYKSRLHPTNYSIDIFI